MSEQPSSLTEQVTVILSPDPQAREIGADLLREAAADMGLHSEFEDFISDVPSLFARAIRLGVKFKRGD